MDQTVAMTEIHRIAREAGIAVSIVTVEDVASLKGISGENVTPALAEKIRDTYEWRNFGDNWAETFDDIDL